MKTICRRVPNADESIFVPQTKNSKFVPESTNILKSTRTKQYQQRKLHNSKQSTNPYAH